MQTALDILQQGPTVNSSNYKFPINAAFEKHHPVTRNMDRLQLQVESVGNEVSRISDILRGYLEHGVVSDRKVQPPRTKAGRDLLQHLLGRLGQVSASLTDISRLTASSCHLSPPSPPPPQAVCRVVTPFVAHTAAAQQLSPLDGQVENETTPTAAGPNEASSGLPSEALVTGQTAKLNYDIQYNRTSPFVAQECGFSIFLSPMPHCIRLKDGSAYFPPIYSPDTAPLFDCTYQDIHVLNEELFELYSSHPLVQNRGYFKLQVRNLPPLNVQRIARPSRDHATSFRYKIDKCGLVKVDTGKRYKVYPPNFPLPSSAKTVWTLAEQKDLWNSSAADPPKGNQPYIIGNPLFDDIELSPGEKLRRRGRTKLEGINTQYVYFNLAGKTITTMHREDAHVRSENLLRSGQHKFWCFVKPAFSRKLEERMAVEYPEMRRCSQAVRHLSRHIPPAKLDEWGIEYTLDYCIPGQAMVTEPGTYHQVLNLGPNYALAINLEYSSSPDMPPDYRFCDRHCPDKFAISADDFRIYDQVPTSENMELAKAPCPAVEIESHEIFSGSENVSSKAVPPPSPLLQSATPPPEHGQPSGGGKTDCRTSAIIIEDSLQAPPTNSEYATTGCVLGDHHSPALPNGCASSTTPELPPFSPLPAPKDIVQSDINPKDNVSQSSGYPGDSKPTELSDTQPVPGESHPSVLLPHQPSLMGVHARPVESRSLITQLYSISTSTGPQHEETEVPLERVCLSNSHGSSEPELTTGQITPIQNNNRVVGSKRGSEESVFQVTKKPKADLSTRVECTALRGPFEHLSMLIRDRVSSTNASLTPDRISNKLAFDRLSYLIREWRRYCTSTPVILGGLNLIKSVEETAQEYPELHTFLSRLFKLKLSEIVDRLTTAGASECSSPAIIDGLLCRLRWDDTKRHVLHDFVREGKCWRTICGHYDGLLSLMPSNTDCFELALFKDQVSQFHASLDTELVRRMCAVGSTLQRAIWDCLELPEFVFETTATTWLSIEQISPFLVPFRLIRSNHYNEQRWHRWPKPPSWPATWPVDPTIVFPNDQPCELCTASKTCRCIGYKIPRIPRISDDKSKGPGIRSVGPHRANDILGELVGELMPVGTQAAQWTMELCRPDLNHQAVAEIYPRFMGNWVRKVRHESVKPSATFRPMKISGRWRMMLVALRDIQDGEEITAKFGKGFLKEQPYDVVEGLQ